MSFVCNSGAQHVVMSKSFSTMSLVQKLLLSRRHAEHEQWRQDIKQLE